jgi:hypothetical protein
MPPPGPNGVTPSSIKKNNLRITDLVSKWRSFWSTATPQLRKFFHWSIGQFFVGLFLPTGIGFALANHFILAYSFLSAFGLWLILLWLFSDFLAHKRAVLSERRIRKHPAMLQKEKSNYRVWQWSISGLLAIISLACLFWVHMVQEQHELESLQGWLLPANDPDPQPDICSGPFTPHQVLKIHLGKFEVFASVFPYTVLAVNKQKAIIINRDENGRIAVSMEIRDKDSKIVVLFENGHFTVNENNFLKRGTERPDRSTLIVHDQWNNEVLNARYRNKNYLDISALLQYPGAKPVSIPRNVNADVCLGDVGSIAINVESH